MDSNKPDKLGKTIRFGCGFLFGAVVILMSEVIELAQDNPWLFGGIVLGGALAIGYGSMRYGDRFWEWMAGR